jgi:hypothetical protein
MNRRKMRTRVRDMAALAAGIGLASAGCSGVDGVLDGSGGGSATEPIASDSSELSVCACNQDSYLEFEATSSTPVFGPSTTTHICWPTIYAPTTGSNMPSATVAPTACNQGGCTWKATGDVTMTCVPQCCFGSNGGSNDVRWLSERFIAVASIAGSATVA